VEVSVGVVIQVHSGCHASEMSYHLEKREQTVELMSKKQEEFYLPSSCPLALHNSWQFD
jgi:hypothetical protein